MSDEWSDTPDGQDWLDEKKAEKEKLEKLLKEMRKGVYND